MLPQFFVDLALKVAGVIIVAGLCIGAMASISGDIRNSDDIGGAIGEVGGAGIFGGIFGEDGMIASAMDQRAKFDGSTTSKVPDRN